MKNEKKLVEYFADLSDEKQEEGRFSLKLGLFFKVQPKFPLQFSYV